METNLKEFGPIHFTIEKSEISKTLISAEEIIEKAKSEVFSLLNQARTDRDKIFEEARNKGYLSGIKQGLEQIADSHAIAQHLIDLFSNDVIKIVHAVISELIDPGFFKKHSLLDSEIESRVSRTIEQITNERINIDEIISIEVPIGHCQNLKLAFPHLNLKITETKECGNQIFKILTSQGSYICMHAEHLQNLLSQLKNNLNKNQRLAAICKQIIDEINKNED